MIPENKIDLAIRKLFDGISFPERPEVLYDPLRYMIVIGGKRLRPRLCLTTFGLYKDDFGPGILGPASGLEVFHSFTLIHDDIMDCSPLRRGEPTVWKKWSSDTAILSGDAMCIDSYKRIAMAPSRVLGDALKLFSATAAEVCEGQQMDMDFESMDRVSMEEYMKMIGLKTGVLIACSARMGALIGGASDEDCSNLYQYGYNLGLAFQVADDFLDAFGDEKVFGKPIGGDIVNNKKCWLTTRAFEKATDPARIEAVTEMRAETQEEKEKKIRAMKGIYRELEVDKDAQEEISRLNAKALEYAGKVCTGVRYEQLRRFADKLIGRTK